MKRKLKQWWSTILRISTKRTTTSYLKSLNTKKTPTYSIGNLSWLVFIVFIYTTNLFDWLVCSDNFSSISAISWHEATCKVSKKWMFKQILSLKYLNIYTEDVSKGRYNLKHSRIRANYGWFLFDIFQLGRLYVTSFNKLWKSITSYYEYLKDPPNVIYHLNIDSLWFLTS